MKWTRMALGISLALGVALSANVGASGHTYTDAPRHDVYAATARCFAVPSGRIPGIPVAAIMRDDDFPIAQSCRVKLSTVTAILDAWLSSGQ
jgi:hypothetical protein